MLVVFKELPGHEHFVNNGCFTVVNVRYNSNVSNVLHKLTSKLGCKISVI